MNIDSLQLTFNKLLFFFFFLLQGLQQNRITRKYKLPKMFLEHSESGERKEEMENQRRKARSFQISLMNLESYSHRNLNLTLFFFLVIYNSLLNLLHYCFCFSMFLFFGHKACGIL